MAMIQDPSWGKTLAEAYKDDLYKMMGESLVFNGVRGTISEYKPTDNREPNMAPGRYVAVEEIRRDWKYNLSTAMYTKGSYCVTREAVDDADGEVRVVPKWVYDESAFHDGLRVGPTFEKSTPYKRRGNSPWGYGLPSFLTSPHDHNVSDHSVSAVNAGEHSHSISEVVRDAADWFNHKFDKAFYGESPMRRIFEGYCYGAKLGYSGGTLVSLNDEGKVVPAATANLPAGVCPGSIPETYVKEDGTTAIRWIPPSVQKAIAEEKAFKEEVERKKQENGAKYQPVRYEVTISGSGTGASVTYNPTATISYGAKADDPIVEGNIHHAYGRLYYGGVRTSGDSGDIFSTGASPAAIPAKPLPKQTSLDIAVPTSFRIDDYFGVIMRLEDGTLEADPEPFVSEAGAKERARQLMYARKDVVSCATTTIWKRA